MRQTWLNTCHNKTISGQGQMTGCLHGADNAVPLDRVLKVQSHVQCSARR